jgi:hypothetical protein
MDHSAGRTRHVPVSDPDLHHAGKQLPVPFMPTMGAESPSENRCQGSWERMMAVYGPMPTVADWANPSRVEFWVLGS